jgi:hypothetical protein
MPEADRQYPAIPSGHPSDELVLAAIERAGRHHPRGDTAIPAWAILDHLAIRRRSAGARRVHAQLDLLRETGWLERSRRHGVPTWELTDMGRDRVRLALGAGDGLRLPESPQHRAWRTACASAEQESERFRAGLRERLEQAMLQLDAPERARSDDWFELAHELQRACWRLASATYCLHEWVEPDDASADVDKHLDRLDEQLSPGERVRRRARRAGRRNIGLWDDRS